MSENVAIIGLGAMGRRMAGRLLDAGFDVVVWNRSAGPAADLVARGARAAESPRAAAAAADVVIACVTDDDASRAVWLGADGALAGLRAGALAIESSTLTPGWVRELADSVAGAGAAFLDAPVVGSRPQADQGALIHLVGGDEAALERARPAFDAIGGRVEPCGPVGSGAVMKLAVNALLALEAAGVAELLGFAAAAGVAPDRAAALLAAMPVTSPAMTGFTALMAAKDHAPRFTVALIEKDLRYARDAAAAVGAELPAVDGAREVFARALATGRGEANFSAIAELYER